MSGHGNRRGGVPSNSTQFPGLSQSLLTSTSTEAVAAAVSNRVTALYESIQRLRVEARMLLPYVSVMDDCLALAASVRHLRDSVPPVFSSLAVTPHEVDPELAAVAAVPELLATLPDADQNLAYDQAFREAKERASFESSDIIAAATTPYIEGKAPFSQVKMSVQKLNTQLDALREHLNHIASAKGKVMRAAPKPPTVGPPKLSVLRRDYEILHGMLSELYSGTELALSPLQDSFGNQFSANKSSK